MMDGRVVTHRFPLNQDATWVASDRSCGSSTLRRNRRRIGTGTRGLPSSTRPGIGLWEWLGVSSPFVMMRVHFSPISLWMDIWVRGILAESCVRQLMGGAGGGGGERRGGRTSDGLIPIHDNSIPGSRDEEGVWGVGVVRWGVC